jgi:hypothetical protein
MKLHTLMMLASALVIAACTDHPKDGGDGSGSGSGSGDGTLSVIDWANDMATRSEPDTIQDKFAIVIDTDDAAAFDDVIEVAKQQAAADAAAGD